MKRLFDWFKVMWLNGNKTAFCRVMFVVLFCMTTLHVSGETTNGIGVFSVSATKRVSFAPGNLQYTHAATDVWSFASEQYEILGTNNAVGGSVVAEDKQGVGTGEYGYGNTTATNIADKIDLFYWSETLDKQFGVSITSSDDDVKGTFVDWGILPSAGHKCDFGYDPQNPWYTLTYDEWYYLRYTRTNADQLYGVAKITDVTVADGVNGAGVNGVIFLPDNWVCPDGIMFTPGCSTTAGMTWFDDTNSFTLAQWHKLEAAGAVFFPAAGFRSTWKMYNVQYSCGYWSSSSYSNTSASHLGLNSSDVYVQKENGRRYGRAVRLAQDTLPIVVDCTDTKVTSTAGQTIRKAIPITITNHFTTNTTITGTSNNPAFTVVTLENKDPGTYNLIVNYNPTLTDDGIETATITLSSSTMEGTTSFTMTGRHLPQDGFAIVTKVGSQWYALPADCSTSGNPVAQVVEVDDNDNPTKVIKAPKTLLWKLKSVAASRYAEHGSKLVFTGNNDESLYASANAATIQTYAKYENYHSTNPARYEWAPTTSDLTEYTLLNTGERATNLSISTSKEFGTYKQTIASSTLRFLPVTNSNYLKSNVKIVEWSPTKIRISSSHDTYSTRMQAPTLYIGSKEYVLTLGSMIKPIELHIWEISDIGDLTTLYGELLHIEYEVTDVGTFLATIPIPVIISQGEKAINDIPVAKEEYNYLDLVVRDGATLTIDGENDDNNKFFDVTICPTSKISVPLNKKLSVHSLTFLGGIDDIYDGSAYTTNRYGVPELSLKGSLQKAVSTIDYVMCVDLSQMYSLTLPYDVELNDITYWDGTAMTPGTDLYISAYDGAARAREELNRTWIYETDFETKFGTSTLKAGMGYTVSSELRVSQYSGQTFDAQSAYIRFPMKSNISSGSTEGEKTVAVTAYGIDSEVSDNHKGWNLVGNPYMTSISGGEADSKLVVGYLKETGTGPWEWVEDNCRYVTIPSDNGRWYSQQKFSDATLPPFKNFFLQIQTDGELSFALANRQNAPARYLENKPQEREVEFELLLSDGTQSDNTGLLIAEQFTPAYEINADLEKMLGSMAVYTLYGGYKLAYNALSPVNATEWIPIGYVVPSAGEYSFMVKETEDLDELQYLYLMDYETGETIDLLQSDYSFMASKKNDDARFAINVVLKAGTEDNTATGLEDLKIQCEQPQKFIYCNQMYILHQGKIYDATGRQITTINK